LNSAKRYTIFRSGLILSLYLIAVTFPLPYKLSNPWIITMVLFGLLERIYRPQSDMKPRADSLELAVLWSFLALFGLISLSLVYTDNLDLGLKNIEGKLSLLAFPVILYHLRLKKKEFWSIISSFIISITLATIYLLAKSTIHYYTNSSWLTYHDFVRDFGGHAVFYSYYLFLSIVLSIFLITKKASQKAWNVLYASAILIALIGLLFCASKNVTVVSLFFGVGILLKRYLKKGIRGKEILITAAAVLALAVVALQMKPVKNRMAELFSGSGMQAYEKVKRGEQIKDEDVGQLNGTSVRLIFWYIGIDEVFDQDKLLLGLSPGDRRDLINERYRDLGLYKYYKSYNLHNQFIQTFVELGLLGLLIYCLLNFFLLLMAIKHGNGPLLVLLLASLIFQMTESILERNKGIVFFIFFFCFLQQLRDLSYESRNTGH